MLVGEIANNCVLVGLKIVTVNGGFTTTVVQLVALPQLPLTSRQYVAAFVAETLVRTRELPVWPTITVPFFFQTLVIELPVSVTLSVTVEPAQTFVLEGPMAVVVTSTVRVAEFVALPIAPVASTV